MSNSVHYENDCSKVETEISRVLLTAKNLDLETECEQLKNEHSSPLTMPGGQDLAALQTELV